MDLEVDDEDAWEDEPEDTFRSVFKEYEARYNEKFKKWEEISMREALENNQLN